MGSLNSLASTRKAPYKVSGCVKNKILILTDQCMGTYSGLITVVL